MKKIITRLFSLICALAIFVCAFTACTDDKTPENGSQVSSYKITTQKDEIFGDYYKISSDIISATAGKTVTVSVKDLWDFLSIENVYANDVACNKSEEGKYTFTMPEKDVTVTADFKVNIIKERADGMKWVDADVLSEGTSLSGGIEVDFGDEMVINSSQATSDGYSTMMYVKVISTNQEVVPAEAITRITSIVSSNGAYAKGARISFDVTKVSAGKTTLILIDTDNERAISIEVNVVK